MNASSSAGKHLRDALHAEQPLQMVGTINAYCAMLAKQAGFKAIYLSGAGVANASYGLPDLGITTLDNVIEDVRRITAATDLPLLVDADTGFNNITETVERLIAAGAAGIHIEDQVSNKRCGHRPNKQLVPMVEMMSRIDEAITTRNSIDPHFVIMARTDAFAAEGAGESLRRMQRYIDAGADMLFPEALTELSQYQHIIEETTVPVLANITEFGKTPLFTVDELKSIDVSIALYPLSAFRMMSAAAWQGYSAIRNDGSQQAVVDQMQTREALYQHLDYYRHEAELDREHDDDSGES
ncbi:Methylisocitrate lyase [hydrothermal vent metagenome]|uniref:Methylisocitrate lyase n=1 Tax=hydrothermal vent metagenome TaxID=652676 RepID=A0A3B0Z6D0_9ZZZZ